jgi:hypothetical protein
VTHERVSNALTIGSHSHRILLRSHETGDWFLENSHLSHLATTSQGADASWLTDEHSVVELHADQHGTVGFPSLLGPIEGAPPHQA